MRVAAALLVGLSLLALPAAASAETHILSPNASFTTKEELDDTLDVTISGTFTSVDPSQTGQKPCQYDAFYVWGCLPKPTSPGTVFVGVEADNYSPQQIRHLVDPNTAEPPPYRRRTC